MSAYEPELGHMVFGNGWGEFGVPKQVGEMLYELAESLIDNINDDPVYGTEYVNDVFEMHPYYWGDCTCGFEDEEIEWEETHPHKSDCFHVKYERYIVELEQKGILPYGKTEREYNKLLKQFAKENGFKGLYGIAIYCDCGRDEEYEKWRETHDHKPDCPIVVPNFLYKPTGLAIYWYKYIGRDMSANQKIRLREFREIINYCLQSAEEDIKKASEKKNIQRAKKEQWKENKRAKGYICQDCVNFLEENHEGKVICFVYIKEEEKVTEDGLSVITTIPIPQDYKKECVDYIKFGL